MFVSEFETRNCLLNVGLEMVWNRGDIVEREIELKKFQKIALQIREIHSSGTHKV